MTKAQGLRLPLLVMFILLIAAVAHFLMAAEPTTSVAVPQIVSLPEQPRASIAIGPYVQNVSDVSAIICWATISGQVNLASSGVAPTVLHTYNHHRLKLEKLKPGTNYTYDVLQDEGDLGRGTFTSMPQGEHPFVFDVISDTHSRTNLNHRSVVQQVIADKPAMVFNCGDLVNDGLDILDWEDFFQINRELMRSVPYYVAYGNHDRQSRYWSDFFAMPGNGHFYSINRGSAHFIVLDVIGPYISETDPVPSQADLQQFYQMGAEHWQRQMKWLKQDLEDSKNAKYLFVFFHYPVYHPDPEKALPRDMRGHFGSIFQDYRVSTVFNGHTGYYKVVEGGVPFVTLGSTHVRVEVGSNKALVRTFALDGMKTDEFVVAARMAPAPAPASKN